MWDMYNDDDSFQRLARGRGFHDGQLLAKVLYGKQVKQQNKIEEENKKHKTVMKNKHLKVNFNHEPGDLALDQSLGSKEENCDDFEYLWRTRDYSFHRVKNCSDFVVESGVRTDVMLFDRRVSSEFDDEHEELKDELVEWNKRYQQRMKNKTG